MLLIDLPCVIFINDIFTIEDVWKLSVLSKASKKTMSPIIFRKFKIRYEALLTKRNILPRFSLSFFPSGPVCYTGSSVLFTFLGEEVPDTSDIDVFCDERCMALYGSGHIKHETPHGFSEFLVKNVFPSTQFSVEQVPSYPEHMDMSRIVIHPLSNMSVKLMDICIVCNVGARTTEDLTKKFDMNICRGTYDGHSVVMWNPECTFDRKFDYRRCEKMYDYILSHKDKYLECIKLNLPYVSSDEEEKAMYRWYKYHQRGFTLFDDYEEPDESSDFD